MITLAVFLKIITNYQFYIRNGIYPRETVKLKRKPSNARAQQYAGGESVKKAEVEEKKRDEEIGILADNSRIQPPETIDDGLKFPADLEQDQNLARVRVKARAQAREKLSAQMRRKAEEADQEANEVENQKPLSLKEIMKGIEE